MNYMPRIHSVYNLSILERISVWKMAFQSRNVWFLAILSRLCVVRAEGGDGSADGADLPSFNLEINK